jgi:glycosyltransferase involved in cell wall biosynthesis
MSGQRAFRIMMTTDAVGGVWTYSTSLAGALSESGCDVWLVVLGPKPSDAQRRMVQHLDRVRLIETDLALEWQDPGAADLPRARTVLASFATDIAPDLVHLNGFREATFDWTVPCVVVAHSSVTTWADACNDRDFLSAPEWRRYEGLVHQGLRAADAWVAPSRAFHDAVVDRHDAPNGHVIFNGIAPRQASIKSKADRILGAGRVWDKAKNVGMVADLAADIDWPICIAGTGADPAAKTDVFCGELAHDELLNAMDEAGIFVSLARYEPFGLSVLEAARAGCALVLSSCPTFCELWDSAALFVDADDRVAATQALRQLCSDHSLRHRLQQAARERARRFSLQEMRDDYLALYTSLIDAQPRLEARERVMA